MGHAVYRRNKDLLGMRCIPVLLYLLALITTVLCEGYRKPVIRYPKDTQFWATDFFVRGCKNFVDKCPKTYKYQRICARSYDGDYKDFPNYCLMQYENCNSWRSMYNNSAFSFYRVSTDRVKTKLGDYEADSIIQQRMAPR